MKNKSKRPIEGEALAEILQELARADMRAVSLRFDLDPLSDEDKRSGAKPLSMREIQDELENISRTITGVALFHLGASRDEWYAAHEDI
ncbi:hypothetical protein [Acuticoccus sediminis]|nr:hypothetical protein [Acuticoccus sediminis]